MRYTLPLCIPFVMAMASGPLLAATLADQDCNALRVRIDQLLRWESVSDGVSQAKLTLNMPNFHDMHLIMFEAERHQLRVFDLRDVGAKSQSRGIYGPPLYALSELAQNTGNYVLLSSAGMTKSYADPVPAGLLLIDGVVRMPVAPKDRVLDGTVCIGSGGDLSVRSVVVDGGRRASVDVAGCIFGFQAGPVLVANGLTTSTAPPRLTSRVVLALLPNNQVVLGYSSGATAVAMACALTASRLGSRDAIALQSDALGGVILGDAFARHNQSIELGNVEATIASALVVQTRIRPLNSVSTRRSTK